MIFQNFLKIAWRNLLRQKGYSAINIIGLATGIAACILIFLYAQDELSFDRFHSKADRIYRVTRDFSPKNSDQKLHLGHVAPPFGPLLEQDFPEVQAMSRMYGGTFLVEDVEKQKTFTEERTFYAEAGLFDIFDIPVLEGNAKKALSEPFQVMIAEKLAKKYFPEGSAMGKVLRLDNQYNVKVAGVFKELPANSHMHPEVLISFPTLNDTTIYGSKQLKENFGNNAFGTYLLLAPGVKPENMEAKFPAFIDRHFIEHLPDASVKPSSWTHLYLQKLTDIHLRSHLDSEVEPNGDIASVRILIAVALFILVIACINYINLSTARSTARAKEVGIRKVIGAYQWALVGQFLLESVLISLFATVLALGLTELLLNWLNEFTGKEISLNLFTQKWMLPMLIFLPVLVGVLAGLYPAFYLSGFQPVRVLKGSLSSSSQNPLLRKSLVVLQFAISIVLIIATGIMFQQLRFMQSKSLGFDKDRVIVMPYYPELLPKYQAFKEELQSSSHVGLVAKSNQVPSDRLLSSLGSARVMKNDSMADSEVVLKFVVNDHDFLDVYKAEFAAGRNFSKSHPTDDTAAFIINELAARSIGWKTPQEAIGKPIQYGGMRGQVIGVVKDMHFESMHQEIAPTLFVISRSDRYNALSIKINGDPKEALTHVQATWQKFMPKYPFDYEYVDDRFKELYEAEQKKGQIFMAFSGVAILIACLGLLGLASFTTRQRTKEIGIRKVFGASVARIVALLSTDFLKLVLVANVLAWPIVWWAMNKWLQDFAYRITIGIGIFLLAAGIAVLLAIFTVSWQATRAALLNPIRALRNE